MPPLAAGKIAFQNVIDAQGYSIAIAGMLIVFAALAVISLFIATLPRLLEIVEEVFPALPESHAAEKAAGAADADPDGALVAAIGFALHRLGKGQSPAGG